MIETASEWMCFHSEVNKTLMWKRAIFPPGTPMLSATVWRVQYRTDWAQEGDRDRKVAEAPSWAVMLDMALDMYQLYMVLLHWEHWYSKESSGSCLVLQYCTAPVQHRIGLPKNANKKILAWSWWRWGQLLEAIFVISYAPHPALTHSLWSTWNRTSQRIGTDPSRHNGDHGTAEKVTFCLLGFP